MTIDRLHLAELIEKGSDVDLLREMMTFVVDRMLDLDVESLTGAAYGERSADRTNQRNGYRERPFAVETVITDRPPHRSARADFPHAAPTLGV